MENVKQQQAENFNTLINELKKEKIINSQEEFAYKIEVSPVTVSNWKNGKYLISQKNAEIINRHFPNYPINWLMGRTDAKSEYEKASRIVDGIKDRTKAHEQLLYFLAYLNGWRVEKPEYSHEITSAASIGNRNDHYIIEALKEMDGHCIDLVRGEERIPLSLAERQSLITKMVDLFEFEITHRF